MANSFNQSLLSGQCKDFGTAISALKSAMHAEAREEPRMAEFFNEEAEKCGNAKAIYDKLYAEFRAKLAKAMVGAGLDEFVEAIESDDYTKLGY